MILSFVAGCIKLFTVLVKENFYLLTFLAYPVAHIEINGGALLRALRQVAQGLPIVGGTVGVHSDTVVARRIVHAALFAGPLNDVEFLHLRIELHDGVFHVYGAGRGKTHSPGGF